MWAHQYWKKALRRLVVFQSYCENAKLYKKWDVQKRMVMLMMMSRIMMVMLLLIIIISTKCLQSVYKVLSFYDDQHVCDSWDATEMLSSTQEATDTNICSWILSKTPDNLHLRRRFGAWDLFIQFPDQIWGFKFHSFNTYNDKKRKLSTS